jgi:hypothetical protein
MSRVRVVQMFTDEIVGVIAVGHRLVSTAGPMRVSLRMTGARVRRRAGGRVAHSASNTTLVHVIAVLVMQVAVVKVVGVALVLDRPVPAAGAVRVCMPRVRRVLHQTVLLFLASSQQEPRRA